MYELQAEICSGTSIWSRRYATACAPANMSRSLFCRRWPAVSTPSIASPLLSEALPIAACGITPAYCAIVVLMVEGATGLQSVELPMLTHGGEKGLGRVLSRISGLDGACTDVKNQCVHLICRAQG